MKRFLLLIRKFHLYSGLFLSPFILIYSISILSFNHEGLLNRIEPVKVLPEIRTKLDFVPFDTSDLSTAKGICRKLGIDGEVDFISRGGGYFSFPVYKPGIKTQIRINLLNDSVYITRENQGNIRAMSYLHKMPGPHNVNIRGNTGFIRFWRLISSMVVYILLFLTASGVFLWYFLKIERNMGLFAISLGIFLLTVLLLLIL